MYNLRRKYTSQRPILNHQTVIFTKSFNIDKSSWNNNAMAYLQKHQWGLIDLGFFFKFTLRCNELTLHSVNISD